MDLFCAEVPLRKCSLTHPLLRVPNPNRNPIRRLISTLTTMTRRHDTSLAASFRVNPGKLVLERFHSGFYWSKDDGGGVSGDNRLELVQSSSQIVATNKPTLNV